MRYMHYVPAQADSLIARLDDGWSRSGHEPRAEAANTIANTIEGGELVQLFRDPKGT